MRNISRILKNNILNYRHFGVFWWRVKRELRAAGALDLGPTDERWQEIDGTPEAEFWSAAYSEAHTNAVTQHLSPHVWTPDGVSYTILDTDLEPGNV